MVTDGIINFLKPSGITSSDAVIRVRKILGRRDVGHLGTLDPMGAGVLPIAIGKATKLFDAFQTKLKTYRATFSFGFDSDTLDSAGTVVKHGRIPTTQEIESVLPSLTGNVLQMPPAYSAKKIGGKKAYELARAGREVSLQPKNITIEKLAIINRFSENTFVFEIKCSSGTYIRSIARDIAHELGTCAIMSSIIRTSCGQWTLSDSISTEELSAKKYDAVIAIEECLSSFRKILVTQEFCKNLYHGLPCDIPELFSDEYAVLYCDNLPIGVAIREESRIKMKLWINHCI